MLRSALIAVPLVLAAGCKPTPVEAPEPAAAAVEVAAEAPATPAATAKERAREPSEHGHDDVLMPCPAGNGELLDRAITFYDADRFEEALWCAAQAAVKSPHNPDTHAEKAAALVALARYDEARTAYARALAIDPDHADALLGAADLYLSRLAGSREYNELGLDYANHGHTLAVRKKDRKLAGQFALLLATAHNNLGEGQEAIARAEEALAAGVDAGTARFEKASALYELCRFAEAKKDFQKLLADKAREPWAHRYLGLIAERDGDAKAAERELALATKLAPDEFPKELDVSAPQFRKLVDAAVAELPDDMKRDLKQAPVMTQDLPDLADLVSGEPVLSPAILGLFRGPALNDECLRGDFVDGRCRTIVLYRKNLLRAVKDEAELEKQVRITLVHEIGHLRGEDDLELAARGLE